MARGQQSSLDQHEECASHILTCQCATNAPESADYSNSGKAIAIRLAEDGFDVCINDIAANKAGIDEVRIVSPPPYAQPHQ